MAVLHHLFEEGEEVGDHQIADVQPVHVGVGGEDDRGSARRAFYLCRFFSSVLQTALGLSRPSPFFWFQGREPAILATSVLTRCNYGPRNQKYDNAPLGLHSCKRLKADPSFRSG